MSFLAPVRRRGCRIFPLIAATVTLIHLAATPVRAVDDFGTWQWVTLGLWKEGPWSVSTFTDTHWVNDSRDFSLLLTGPQVRYEAAPHTSFGLGGYYLHVVRGHFLDDTNQWWLDADMLNQWNATPWLVLSVRNKIENRWLEDPNMTKQVSRHRMGACCPLKDAGPLTKVYANEEFFYDWDRGEINENRLIPVAFGLRFSPHWSLDLFPMLRSCRWEGGWRHEALLGTWLQASF